MVRLRVDSALFTHDTLATARRQDVRVSVTARMNPAVLAAIGRIDEGPGTPIVYAPPYGTTNSSAGSATRRSPNPGSPPAARPSTSPPASWRAESSGSRRAVAPAVTANRTSCSPSTATTRSSTTASCCSRPTSPTEHAIIEQVVADPTNGPLAHPPSGKFTANAAWLGLAATAFDLTRGAGSLASRLYARAATSTLRTQLINDPARLARSARRLVVHLPEPLAPAGPLRAATHRHDKTPTAGT